MKDEGCRKTRPKNCLGRATLAASLLIREIRVYQVAEKGVMNKVLCLRFCLLGQEVVAESKNQILWPHPLLLAGVPAKNSVRKLVRCSG